MEVKVSLLKVHPDVLKLRIPKNNLLLEFTMLEFGQLQPLVVIEEKRQYLIVDGVERFEIAKKHPSQFPSLQCSVLSPADYSVAESYLLNNTRAKKSIVQTCREIEMILEGLGIQQGTKRKAETFDLLETRKLVGRKLDRFDWAKLIAGVEFSASTLKHLMKVYWHEQESDHQLDLLSKIDKGELSVDRAYKLVESKLAWSEKAQKGTIPEKCRIVSMKGKPYKLYNKSSLQMDEVEDNSVALAIDSHPYFNLRKYRNQDELQHGREASVNDYFKTFSAFNQEKYKKLKPGGVLVTIIGETYQDGYRGVGSIAELELIKIGFKIIDVVIWVKTNAKYAPHKHRFRNTYERIIVAYKPGAEPYFNPVMQDSSTKDFKVLRSNGGTPYLGTPKTCITNVINTPAFNWKELNEIDPDFKHDAPAPSELYRTFILSYSQPGDTILDAFVGSGTVGVALEKEMGGRTVIGYDVDNESIKFCRKRFEFYLNKADNRSSIAA